jgi:hypothetical protein
MSVSYRSVSYAGIVTVVAMTVITILGELVAPFMKLLTILTGHHWVTKNILSVVIFLVVLALTSKSAAGEGGDSPKGLLWTGIAAVVCSFVLLAFFVIDFMKG